MEDRFLKIVSFFLQKTSHLANHLHQLSPKDWHLAGKTLCLWYPPVSVRLSKASKSNQAFKKISETDTFLLRAEFEWSLAAFVNGKISKDDIDLGRGTIFCDGDYEPKHRPSWVRPTRLLFLYCHLVRLIIVVTTGDGKRSVWHLRRRQSQTRHSLLGHSPNVVISPYGELSNSRWVLTSTTHILFIRSAFWCIIIMFVVVVSFSLGFD